MHERPFHTGTVGLNAAVGPPNGPPLVLLHGVTRRWRDFRPLLPDLAFNHQLHGIDLRGHGRSAHQSGHYRVVDYVPDITTYLDAIPKGPVVLLGHSLAGMIAAAVAAEAPDRVRGLILEDPTFDMTGRRIGETMFLSLFRAFLPHAGSDRPVAEIAAALAEAPIGVPGRAGTVRLGDLRDLINLRLSASGLKQLDPDVLTTPLAGRWLDGYDVQRTLSSLRCPTLFLQADPAAGGALPEAYGREIAASIADVAHVRLPGIGHNIHGSAPEAMLRVVLAFLDSLD